MTVVQRTLALTCLLLLLQAPLASAEESLPDVRMLIDVSGSMRESDPQNLRKPALELMVQLLPEGSRAGVWTFGQWVNMVVPHGEVGEAWRLQASGAVAEISNRGLLTNIPAALERSTFDIEQLEHRYRTSVILLTDGKVEVSKDPAENLRAEQDLLEKVALELRDWGVVVHTIALSDEADWEFLQAFAQITGGLAERAQSAEELSAVFLQALDIAAPTEQIPLRDGEFLTDASVEEITVLVFPGSEGGEVELIDPAGTVIAMSTAPAGVTWHHNNRFELITIDRPEEGRWRIVAPGSTARVNVISHLSMALDRLPATMPSGHTPEIGVRLLDSEQVITDPDLLALLELSVRVYRADDQQWDITVSGEEAGSSGELRVALPMLSEAGRYELVVHVDGRSFHREVSLVTDVVDPAPRVSPIEAMPAEEVGGGIPGWALPAIASALFLLGLLVWWSRRSVDTGSTQEGRQGWSDDDEPEFNFLDEDDEDR